jgi:hypothetical protein
MKINYRMIADDCILLKVTDNVFVPNVGETVIINKKELPVLHRLIDYDKNIIEIVLDYDA